MKSMLKYEGWRESDRIPRGWMMRDAEADLVTQFLGLGGELYKSLSEAVEFVEKYKKYFYQEDIEKIRNVHGSDHLENINPVHVKGNQLADEWIHGERDYNWV